MTAKEFPDRARPPGSPALWENALVCIFLVLAVCAVFGQTAGFDFVNYDDNLNVYENAVVEQGLSPKSVGWAFANPQTSNWIPLTTLSHMLDCQLFGLHPGRHHLVNIVWHAAAAALLFLVLREMTGSLWRSAFVAAVFAIHPLRVESVAWVSERKDVLSGFFFVLTLWAYARYARRPSPVGYAALAAVYVLGLLSKSMLVTMPAVLLLLDYWPLGRLKDRGELLRLAVEKIPLLALGAGSCAVSLMLPGLLVTGGARLPLLTRLANAVVSCGIYVKQMVYPVGLAIPYPNSPNGGLTSAVAVTTVLLAAISAGAWVLRKNRPYLLVGWFWYLIMLIPVAGIIQISLWAAHADRYTYLPEIGLAIAGTWAVADWSAGWKFQRPVMGALMAATIGALMLCAARQTSCWRNSETLWSHSMSVTQSNYVACCNLGSAVSHKGQTREAMRLFRMALQINPNFSLAHYNLGNDLARIGPLDEAVAEYRKALAIDPGYAEAHNDLGKALVRMGKMEEAFAEFQSALNLRPDFAEARYNLGTALVKVERHKEAIEQYRLAVDSDPGYFDAHLGLGAGLAKMGRNMEAIEEYQMALKINPDDGSAHFDLGNALARVGQTEKAVAEYQKVLDLNPADAEAHRNLGLALAGLGQMEEAVRQYRKAVELNPSDTEARSNLGGALARMGQTQEAIEQYRKALDLSPDQVNLQNSLAWLLATASDAALRDGAKAVALAEQANHASGDANPLVLRTLAAAYAEVGRYTEASATVRRAMALAMEQKNDGLEQTLPQQAELYDAGRPMHAPQ